MTLDDYHKLVADARQAIVVTDAASAMAMRRWHDPPLPKAARVWTGVLAGKRAWRGQAVILPDGSLGYVSRVQRRRAIVWRQAPFVIGEREYFVLRVEQITPYRLPSAVRLGRCKAGHRETPSARKAAACRRNGAMPCHSGKRRGRPRRT